MECSDWVSHSMRRCSGEWCGNGIAFIVFNRQGDSSKLRIGYCSANSSEDNWYKQTASTDFASLKNAANNRGCGPLTAVPFPDESTSNGIDAYLVIGLKDAYNGTQA